MKFYSTKILILIIACNIAALVGYYLLFQHIEAQTRSAASLISTIDLGQQKNSRLSSLRAIVKDTEENRQQLAALLLPSDAEISFIEQIESLAKKNGLSEKTNNVSSIADDAGTSKAFQIQLETTGSWNNTMNFLSQVENLPYNVHVRGFSLNRQLATGKGGGSTWVAMFDINVTESI